MMKYLANNLGLKLLSICIAVVLWLLVINYDDPEINRTFTIPITVTREDILEEMEKVYEVVNQNGMATFYVTGKRSIVDKLSPLDFTANADLSQIIGLTTDSEEKLVPIDIIANRYAGKISINQKTANMKVTIEDLSTRQFYISCDPIGDMVEGYAIGNISVSPNLIKISGPESAVSKINKVAANVNVDELTKDITASVTPVLYNENGGVISSSQLKMSQDKVTVNVEMLMTKTVPVKCQVSGTPADGYHFVGLEYAPESVVIKGKSALLNQIEALEIPAEDINVAGLSQNMERSINLQSYLKKGISLVDPQENKIAIKVIIEQLETKVVDLPIDELAMQNIPEDYEIDVLSDKISVTVRGKSEKMAQLGREQIQAKIDLKDLEEGIHSLPVQITLPQEFEVIGEVNVQLQLTLPIEEPLQSEEETESESQKEETGIESESQKEEAGIESDVEKLETGTEVDSKKSEEETAADDKKLGIENSSQETKESSSLENKIH